MRNYEFEDRERGGEPKSRTVEKLLRMTPAERDHLNEFCRKRRQSISAVLRAVVFSHIEEIERAGAVKSKK